MSAQAIYDSAPLGALIRYCDDRPTPPARFKRKLAAWKQTNGTGRLIRKSPPIVRSYVTAPACFTLHEADFTSGGTIVLVVHRTHDLNSDLRFEVVSAPKPGSWRVLQPYGETMELLHLAEDRSAAEAWLHEHRHPHAYVEPVGGIGEAIAVAKANACSVTAAKRRVENEPLMPAGPKIAFAGGLDCNDYARIWDVLDKVLAKHPDMVLLHGASPKGAEFIAARWADARKVVQITFKPDWTRYAKAAPFKRNDQLLQTLPIGVIVFPGSGITDNLADKAKIMGIPVWRFGGGA